MKDLLNILKKFEKCLIEMMIEKLSGQDELSKQLQKILIDYRIDYKRMFYCY